MFMKQILLCLANTVIPLIVDQKQLDRKTIRNDRLQLLKVHHNASIPLQADCFLSSSCDTKPDRRRQSVSHTGDPVVDDKAGSFLDHPILVSRHAAGTIAYRRETSLRQYTAELPDERIHICCTSILLPMPLMCDWIVPATTLLQKQSRHQRMR